MILDILVGFISSQNVDLIRRDCVNRKQQAITGRGEYNDRCNIFDEGNAYDVR